MTFHCARCCRPALLIQIAGVKGERGRRFCVNCVVAAGTKATREGKPFSVQVMGGAGRAT